MAEGTYEYECSRAELLGIAKPTMEDFLRNKTERDEVKEEELDTENLAEVENQSENFKGIGGKLDELNQILQGTQKKLHRFKAGYGSLTNILKIKLGRNSESPPNQSESSIAQSSDDSHSANVNLDKNEDEVSGSIVCDKDNDSNTNQNEQIASGTPIRKSDLSQALDNQVNNLDRLTEKAEQAEIGMREQTSQMKKFLNFSFLNMGGNK
ncbi:hypothetical protein HHI36_021541 [Cryptolaemus montrouzieri]|uniref:Uncharacterized protein n=1 Tax=Cryptolaemus montrouzieri TaxID=559131 RepID=A0ABD2MX92_9CUCU